MTGRQPGGVPRRRLLRAGGACLAAALAGCPDAGAPPGDDTPGSETSTAVPTTTPWAEGPRIHLLTDYYSRPWETRWQELVTAFRAETGGDIYVEAGMRGRRFAQLLEAGEPPDLRTDTFGSVVEAGGLEPLAPVTNLVGAAIGENGPPVVDPPEGPDGHWQVPYGFLASTFQYRSDVYDELGLSPPKSFRGLRENARAIDDSALEIRGYGVAGQREGKSRVEFQAYLARMGVPPMGLRWRDPDTRGQLEVHFPKREVTALLTFLRDLAEHSPDPTRLGWTGSLQHWYQSQNERWMREPNAGQIAQQSHWNNWPAAIAARQALRNRNGADDDEPIDYGALVEDTAVAPLPTWQDGNVAPEDAWLSAPPVSGFHLLRNGNNTRGARRLLSWLFAEDVERTASLYTHQPTLRLPVYAHVYESAAYRNAELFRDWPSLLEGAKFIRSRIVNDWYTTISEGLRWDPVARYVEQQPFYGLMVHRVVVQQAAIDETYEWGRTKLREALHAGRARFR